MWLCVLITIKVQPTVSVTGAVAMQLDVCTTGSDNKEARRCWVGKGS